ncbi:MAG: hypothetical protein ACTSPY_13210 [Candidatus Helarchaeota archaeon]
MSEDFLNVLLKSSSIDEKIKKLSMVLDKIMEVAIKSINGIETQVQYFESLLINIEEQTMGLESRINALEQSSVRSTEQVADVKPRIEVQKSQEPKVQKIAPKQPVQPINPRAALQSELKALFSKMKR